MKISDIPGYYYESSRCKPGEQDRNTSPARGARTITRKELPQILSLPSLNLKYEFSGESRLLGRHGSPGSGAPLKSLEAKSCSFLLLGKNLDEISELPSIIPLIVTQKWGQNKEEKSPFYSHFPNDFPGHFNKTIYSVRPQKRIILTSELSDMFKTLYCPIWNI